MLVLSRKKRESVVGNGKVKLGFEVDAAVPVHRLEVWERMLANGELSNSGATPGTACVGSN